MRRTSDSHSACFSYYHPALVDWTRSSSISCGSSDCLYSVSARCWSIGQRPDPSSKAGYSLIISMVLKRERGRLRPWTRASWNFSSF